MNIIFFISSMGAGGAERVTANLANYWAELDWRVIVVTMAPTAEDFYKLNPKVDRISIGVSGDSSGAVGGIVANLKRVFAFRRILLKYKPDVAVGMMSTSNVVLALSSFGLRRIVTVGSERTHPPARPLGLVWEVLRSTFYPCLDALVVLSSESAVWMQKNTRTQNISIIPNAATWPLPLQEPMLPPQSLANDRYTLLAVGRLSEEKGFHYLIQAFRRLADDCPEWRLVILGDGPDRRKLELQVDASGLTERVCFPGKVGNVGQWYETSDLYVLSSLFEGFPNTLIEAMAYGLPAISFDCDTGPRDIIRHEIDGLLVPAGDVDKMVEALRRVMSDVHLRKEMSERAIEARERFSLERIAGMWEDLFLELR